jgi:hypothetical protein
VEAKVMIAANLPYRTIHGMRSGNCVSSCTGSSDWFNIPIPDLGSVGLVTVAVPEGEGTHEALPQLSSSAICRAIE